MSDANPIATPALPIPEYLAIVGAAALELINRPRPKYIAGVHRGGRATFHALSRCRTELKVIGKEASQ